MLLHRTDIHTIGIQEEERKNETETILEEMLVEVTQPWWKIIPHIQEALLKPKQDSCNENHMRNIIIRLMKTKDQEKNYKLDWRKNIRHNLLKGTRQQFTSQQK